ncbi:MAG: lipopolysaccharide heptosyltransferase II [Kiritimatiellae bacterium]|nr:lipopolysaccharide heptosyltransferase II [Kiritimatiellia bacterium]
MPASPASASSNAGGVLVCVPNWVGDGIMAMPALQEFRRRNPGARIVLLVKPAMRPLWAMHEVADARVELQAGLRPAVNSVVAAQCERAVILPNSFRSALIPCLAGIPERRGRPGHWRRWLLTDVVEPARGPAREHQVYEYLDLLAPGTPTAGYDPPRLRVPDAAREAARSRLADLPAPRVALLPGAARGPSKQWPAAHFIELGRRLAEQPGARLVVLGSAREAELCGRVAGGIGPAARSLAGETSMADWAALIEACDLVVCNDSGGAHVAAAVGRPEVVIFGMTDPARTAPLGARCRVIRAEGPCSRDIARDDPEAIKKLASITPERVYQAALECLAGR